MIDKTESLEKGIAEFPSIYIEASAACGKTTAVHMLLEKHPEAAAEWLQMDKELAHPERFTAKLSEIDERMQNEKLWVIFENMPGGVVGDAAERLADFVLQLPEHSRAIFVSRERPQTELIELLWKRKLELIPREALLFTPEEVGRLAEERQVRLNTEEISRLTGGWPGCVDMMLRLAMQDAEYGRRQGNAEELLDRFELKDYIRREVLDTLLEAEHKMMSYAAACPWLREELCEAVWGTGRASELLKSLERKGLFFCEYAKKRWKIVPLFYQYTLPAEGEQEKIGSWYEKNGYIAEALRCFRQMEDKNAYRACLVKHYDQVPFLNESYAEVMDWTDEQAELCYLRGMYCYSVQDLEGLDKELQKLKKTKQDGARVREILLNLLFVKPDFPLDSWLSVLEESAQIYSGIRLYGIMGGSFSCLCGLRDLSGMFACTKREEKRREKLWRDSLGETGWKYYRLAQMEYYLDTERKDVILPETWDALGRTEAQEEWQLRLAEFYLLCRRQGMVPDAETEERINRLEEALREEDNAVCARNAEAVGNLFSMRRKAPERLTRWLRASGAEKRIEIKEDNYAMLCCLAKGYLLLSQYEKAGSILRRIIPYVRRYRRSRMLAELLFMQSIVYWVEDRHSQALRSTVESFQVNGNSRYVGAYTGYGKKGRDVLEAYVEWLKKNTPEGWHRKKKYNYGNVLRMPTADYLEVVLRCARKNARSDTAARNEEIRERFTLMEISVLQGIGSGMTNEELCTELNLKLSTVKSHIYSLYKKLEVNSRVQAVLKGRELGILE